MILIDVARIIITVYSSRFTVDSKMESCLRRNDKGARSLGRQSHPLGDDILPPAQVRGLNKFTRPPRVNLGANRRIS